MGLHNTPNNQKTDDDLGIVGPLPGNRAPPMLVRYINRRNIRLRVPPCVLAGRLSGEDVIAI